MSVRRLAWWFFAVSYSVIVLAGCGPSAGTGCPEGEERNEHGDCVPIVDSGTVPDSGPGLDSGPDGYAPDGAVCDEGAMREGETPCGQDGEGVLMQECIGGVWVDTDECTIPDARPGLEVRDGVLYHNDKPFYGIGVNAFDLFYRTLLDNDDTSYVESLAALSDANIPFVRFNCGGYWPVEFDLYFDDEEKYFQLLDGVVAAAEDYGVGLIPSLFWAYHTAPDLHGEPMDQLGNPESATSDYIREYTAKVVQRYMHSPAVWAWQMGNEYNLEVDLPNPEAHRPPVWPHLGTPDHRTERDDLTAEHMVTAYGTFIETVRLYDGDRAVITGNAAPRRSAWHNTHHGTWQDDTEEQFQLILARDNPDPYDTVSIHIYPYSYGDLGSTYSGDLYSGPSESLYEQVYNTQKYSLAMDKPLTIGEFGANKVLGDPGQANRLEEFLYAIEHNHVQLSAIWVYDFTYQEPEGWNITFENDRAFMLDMVIQTNERLALRTGPPVLLTEPNRLQIPNAYFQDGSSWYAGAQTGCEDNVSLDRYTWGDAVRGDGFGRVEMTAPCTYWVCSGFIDVEGDRISMGGYLRFAGIQNPMININMYEGTIHRQDLTAVLPLMDIDGWEWHNIREKGGGSIVNIQDSVDRIIFCVTVTAADHVSEASPALIDMDNFSGFQIVNTN